MNIKIEAAIVSKSEEKHLSWICRVEHFPALFRSVLSLITVWIQSYKVIVHEGIWQLLKYFQLNSYKAVYK